MNILDIVLICVAGIFLIRGLLKGLVQEVLSLTALLLAVYLAFNFRHILTPHLQLYISNETTVNALAFVTLFFGTLIVFWLLAKFAKSMLDITLLGWIDRGAGGLFGLIEGAVIGLIILMFLQSFAPESSWLKESYLAPRSGHLVELFGDMTPDSMRDMIKDTGLKLPSTDEALDSAKDAIGLDDTSQDQ